MTSGYNETMADNVMARACVRDQTQKARKLKETSPSPLVRVHLKSSIFLDGEWGPQGPNSIRLNFLIVQPPQHHHTGE